MSVDVSGRNLIQDRLLRQTEMTSREYVKPKVPLSSIVPNPIYTKPIQYLDSQCFNSHQYPNFKPIKPFKLGYRPSNKSSYIDESIQKTTQVVGGRVFTIADAEPIIMYA